MTTKRRRLWLLLIQTIVTICLMAWLFWEVDWPRLLASLANIRWELIVLGIMFLLVCHAVNIVRWHYLLQPQAASFGTLLVFYGAGLFSNNFLPTGIGGDGVRAALLSRVVSPGRAIVSVALDRGIGLIALSALFTAGWWIGLPPSLELGGGRIAERTAGLLPLIVAAGALMVAAAMVWRLVPGLGVALRRRLAGLAERWDPPRWTLGQWARCFAGGYVLSVFSHLCIVAAMWVILLAIQIEVPVVAAIWLVLISSVSLLLPVAVNGIGVVEGVYVLVLSSYGVPTSIGVGFAVVMRMVALLVSLGGGLALLQRWVPIFEVKG